MKKMYFMTMLTVALSMGPLSQAGAAIITFDFDSGTPALSNGQGTPLTQTVGGLTAAISSTTDGQSAGGFSIQSDSTTFFSMSQFSGHYIYPNSLTPGRLDIAFDQMISDMSFTFATADFHQVEVPTTLQMNAYDKSGGSVLVGSATAHGTYASDTMPMGTLTFNPNGPTFNWVEIFIPAQPLAASDFLIDNIQVTANGTNPINPTLPVPEPASLTLLGFGLGGLLLKRVKRTV